MANGKDFYAVLGVAASASADEIKKQYRRLAKQYHPDSNAGDPKSSDRFKEISEAYGTLGDAAKRKEYDELRRLGAFGGFGTRQSGGGRPGAGTYRRPTGGRPGSGGTSNFDFDVGGIGGLGDLFSTMFGAGGRRPRGPERGETVERTVEVPFRTAVTGGKVSVELEVSEECVTCHGSGGAPGAVSKTCAECGGRGTISFGQGGFAVNRPCPACMGRGQIPSEPCPTCSGAGQIRSRRKVLISVPSGVESGYKMSLKGQGGRGSSGGQPGDLIITFQVLPDRFFTREGLDLIAKVPINVAQATLGSRVSVRTVAGRKVAVRIPAGTASGKRFRIPAQGVAKEGKTGDLIVEVAITVPDQLNDAQEQAMRDFAEASGLKY